MTIGLSGGDPLDSERTTTPIESRPETKGAVVLSHRALLESQAAPGSDHRLSPV